MPIYEYQCNFNSEHKFESRRPMSDRSDPVECPKCGGASNLVVSANSRQSENWAERPYSPTPTSKSRMNKMRG